ncbi:MAG: hypothetical protein Q9227_000245 [Pyrenula ochraceoflavens]
MHLFSKLNKSQTSLNTNTEGRTLKLSAIDSPLQSPVYPSPPQAYRPAGEASSASNYDQQTTLPLTPDETQARSSPSTRRPSRSTSFRNSYFSDGRPTVNIVAPNTPIAESTVSREEAQPPRQSRPSISPVDKDSRRSKRSIFGLPSPSKVEPSTRPQVSRSLSLGRSLSIRDSLPSSPALQQDTAAPFPDRTSSRVVYPNTSQQRLRQQATPDAAPLHTEEIDANSAERYYLPQKVEQHVSPASQVNAKLADEPPPYSSPQTYAREFKPFQSFPPAQTTSNTSNTYLPYQPQSSSERPSLNIQDAYQHARPPSQQSVGPPSPLVPHNSAFDHRPSVSQGKPTLVSPQPQRPASQGTMGRGEGQGANMRQQVNQQQYQHGDQAHGQQYQSTPTPGQSSNRLVREPSNNADPGRASPQPVRLKDELRDDLSVLGYASQDVQAMLRDLQSQKLDLAALMLKHNELRKEPYIEFQLGRHEELQAKYSKVKKYYFEKDAQVNALQNTVAHQRLSMSNTSLDDTEYAARFTRLDGAVGELAFMFRDQWRSVPPWLQNVVNRDAVALGKKEMTAVGRACISRWLVDEIFDHFFHPSLERNLSAQLKIVEKNIRRSGLNRGMVNDTERDDLITKIINWRLTTVEGLESALNSKDGHEHYAALREYLIEKLTASLAMNLKPNENEPTQPPLGLQHHVTSVVDIALSIANNLPKESRDIFIEYFMPGALITDTYMKLETTVLPPLTTPIANLEESIADIAENASTKSAGDSGSLAENGSLGDQIIENNAEGGRESAEPSPQTNQTTSKTEKKKSTFLGLGNRKPTPNDTNGKGSAQSAAQREKEAKEKAEMEKLERERRIRFASFLAVEVRGRGAGKERSGDQQMQGGGMIPEKGANVLYKAPAYGFVQV